MKKLFSFIMIALMSVMTLNAENTRIYCKMAQGWWKVDNAAVGCHSWGNPGPGTTWPGVRMTPVEGETDMWYIDLDVTKVQNVIFTRVNPSGTIADWGAQTKDLTIPTNGNNLFTITTATATWGGNPGCDGTWSKYEVPVPATPTVTEISITGDKYVGTELTFAAKVAGFSADPDIIYEVKAGKGDYEQAQGGKYTPAAAGDYTVKATASYQPEGGKTEEASKEVAFTVTEAPKVGIVVNVTVPTGTPACYFYGDMSGNQFVAMTKVDATHYTIEFPTATTIGWGYKFVWENGNWATNNSDPAGDIKIEPKDGVINVEIKAWATNPGTEYKYTTYTEWQVKFGPKWEFINMDKQQDGTFTVTATWGNTGINIQSGENPIKKDWYPLDDAALTVDKDVVEGEQVTITLTVVDDENVSLHVSKGEGPQPVETKYYAKNNWNGAASEDWSWLEMKKEEDLYVLDSVVFGGTGVNINTKEDDTDAKWFDLKKMKYNEQDTIQALDTVRFELAIDDKDTVLTAILLGRPAPAARKEFVFVAGEAAEANPALFAITWGKDGSNETVKLANKADDIYTAEILETVDSLVLVRCASDATEIIWDGEGMNVWNQTANYELCDTMYFESWVPETNLFAVTCAAPQPVETKYYAKNNWNGAASEDWSWLEMKKEEDLYVLDSVVFGGTGVNINTKEDDADAIWFDLKKMKYNEQDTIQALDTVRFELAISEKDTVLTAILLGRPAPAARKEFVFVAGEAAEANPALFAITWGKDGSNETVKLANKADDIYTAEILETVDSLVLVRCASDATEIIWDGEGMNVWNQTANYELCDTMYFESWVPETNLFAVTCGAPQPVEDKFYVTGNAALVGEEKAWQADAIEMVDYTHTFPMLAAGEYQLKVTDGTWEHAWGYDNLSPTVAVEGLYTDVDGNICFTVYTPNDVTVTFAQGYVVVTGDFKNPQPVEEGFGIILSDETTIKGQKNEKQLDFLEYIIEANLTAGATFQLYDFGNKAAWTETNIDQSSTPNVYINTDNVYEATSNGKYTIYLKMYGPENNQVYIAYDGTGTALEAIMLNGGLKKFMLDGQMYILRNNHLYNAAGNLLK